MKKRTVLLILALLLGLFTQVNAMELKGVKKATSPVYEPTKSAIKKTLKKMGIKFKVDSDGDLLYHNKKGLAIYIIFDETSSGKVWNLQMRSLFSTKKSRYNKLIKYANKWNSKYKVPKLAMRDRDTLVATFNYPIQYGFNPDEFEDNVMSIYETALNKIADETLSMRN